jgi:hypothetical protein
VLFSDDEADGVEDVLENISDYYGELIDTQSTIK